MSSFRLFYPIWFEHILNVQSVSIPFLLSVHLSLHLSFLSMFFFFCLFCCLHFPCLLKRLFNFFFSFSSSEDFLVFHFIDCELFIAQNRRMAHLSPSFVAYLARSSLLISITASMSICWQKNHWLECNVCFWKLTKLTVYSWFNTW